jgi:hypothetical protein
MVRPEDREPVCSFGIFYRAVSFGHYDSSRFRSLFGRKIDSDGLLANRERREGCSAPSGMKVNVRRLHD